MTGRKRLRPELRREQILRAAGALFFESGYEGASLRDLAARVGINKATIYHYFSSKEEILFCLSQEVASALADGVCNAAGGQGEPLALLEEMIRFQIHYLEQHLEGVKVLVEEKKSLRSELQAPIRSREAQILAAYKDALRRCQRAGVVRPAHLTTSAFAILGQVNWLYHWYRPDGPLSIRELADQVVELILCGLLPGPCPPRP